MSYQHTHLLIAVLLGAVCAPGCGGQPNRIPVEGMVTVDGMPLATGAIRFVPEAGTAGPTTGGEILDGRFAIAAADGPFPGTYRVEITASRPAGALVPDDATGRMVAVARQYLPERYNDRSTLRAEIQPGTSPLEFALQSQ